MFRRPAKIIHKLRIRLPMHSISGIFMIPWGHRRAIPDGVNADSKKPSSVSGKPWITTGFAQSFRIGRITDLSERQGQAITDSALTLPAPQSDLAQEMPRDPSIFGFLTIQARQGEKELKDALLENVRRLLMEPGSGFAFVGREYRLVVGQSSSRTFCSAMICCMALWLWKSKCLLLIPGIGVGSEPAPRQLMKGIRSSGHRSADLRDKGSCIGAVCSQRGK